MKERAWLGIVVGFATAIGVLVAWLSASSPEAVRETLRFLSPRAIEIAFLLMVAGAASSFETLRASLPSKSFFAPLAVGFLALVAVRVIPPQTHRIYYDEDIYENVAQNILWMGRAQMCNEGTVEAGTFRCDASEYNKEPNAFPVLLSLAFRFTGVSESAAHALNHAIFALGAVSVFWVSAILFGRASVGVGAALVYTLTPQNLLWGATVAAEPGAASFAALGFGAFLLFTRHPSWRTGLFAASALAFASQFRPESGLILVVAGASVLLVARELLTSRGLWATGLLTLALLVPQLAHIWSVRNERWGSSNSGKFALAYVSGNARTNVGYYTGGEDFPRLFSALALLGLLSPGRRRESFSILVWFLLLFGIFIPFYAGSYRYGADVRFSLMSATPLAILAGAGLGWLIELSRRIRPESRALLAAPYLLAVYAASAYLPFTRAIGRESWASRADHAAALRMVAEVPQDGMVLTHNPGMIHVMGRSAAQTSIGANQPERVDELFRRFPGGVYFHYNFWCNVNDPVQNEFCQKVLATFPTRVVLEESAGFYRYVLYRLLPRSIPPAETPPQSPGG